MQGLTGTVKFRILVFITAATFCFASVFAQAQPADGTISQIAVQGNQRIEPATIRTYIAVQEGDPFDPIAIDRSLKNLFATGLFADVSIGRQGEIMIIRVVENPIINRITFEGNDRLENDKLEPEVQLRPRVVYTRTKVQQDVERILDVYRRSGRFAVTVEPKVIELPQNRVDLVFEINEGEPTYVRKITFIGNEEFSDSDLRSTVLTREERWWRFLTSNDTYDPDRLAFDQELLRRFYLSEGYADFEVTSAVAELSPNRKSFFVTMMVDEGPRYRFGELTVDVSIPNLDSKDIQAAIVPKRGDWYNAEEIESTIDVFTDVIGAFGYAFVDVRPRVSRNAETRTIDIIFDVQEGPRVFVERVEITGNVRTLDKVIRREFRLVEGDAFNTARMRRSRERLQNLGYFKEVEIDNVPSEVYPDRTVVTATVEEQSTGELQFGIGFSSGYGALFDIGIRERNLLGKGQDLRLNFSLAQQQTQIDIGFTEPYFLNRRLAAGADVFATETDYLDEAGFISQSVGSTLRLGFNYNEYMFQRVSYLLSWTRLQGINQFASQFVREQQGTTTTSQISQTFAIDKRNNVIEPTDGYFISLSNDLSGLGGTEKYLRSNLAVGYYYEPFEGWIFSATGSAGHIIGIGESIKVFQRYQLGGNNLRGFDDFGASPRDSTIGDALGGDWVATAKVEMKIPLGLPEEIGITPKIFTDWGSIGSPTDLKERSGDILQSQIIRGSVGLGIEWESPVGPINIDWAHVLRQADFDITQSFRVNFGQRF
ncbi:MAG: outer membrane protein assembly factor BamA [Rhodospirillaceae bacterium]|jgi:outer membrane protein insertion porin family|nr:outer membrane protein assembly factor BamA [Rhodospirillaceae bacterium]